jgi:condensin complex subunit 1
MNRFCVVKEAVDVIYDIAEWPDMFLAVIIRQMTLEVFQGDIHIPEEASTSMSSQLPKVQSLSKLLYLVGHVAIRQLVYLEFVEKEMKTKRSKDTNTTANNAKAPKSNDNSEANDLDQCLGSYDDEIADSFLAIRYDEILYGKKSLLRLFGPMVKHILLKNKLYNVSHFVYDNSVHSHLPNVEPNSTKCRSVNFVQIHVCQSPLLRRELADSVHNLGQIQFSHITG